MNPNLNLLPKNLQETDSFIDIHVNGERLTCDWSGCLFWPDEETLIVSDMHLEKGSSYAAKGQLIPPYDSKVTLKRLAKRIAVWQPKRIISLGDSFHDPTASSRMPDEYKQILLSMMIGRDWIWISGNHDPEAPAEFGGANAKELLIRNLVFRHEPKLASQPGEIAGHLHPVGKISRRSKSVRRPCFASDSNRLIMPSFGSFTGGLNIRHHAFKGLFKEENLKAVMLGQERVFLIAGKHLIA